MTREKSDIASLVIVAALHLVIGGIHQYAHVVAEVDNSPLQVLFILIVVTIAPWAATFIAWKRSLKLGAALYSVSMAASLVFGLALHFALDSPDLYSTVVVEHRSVFFYSALGLALVELAGAVVGAYVAFRSRQSA